MLRNETPCRRIIGLRGPDGFIRCGQPEDSEIHDPLCRRGTPHVFDPAPVLVDDPSGTAFTDTADSAVPEGATSLPLGGGKRRPAT